jgi:hypothetical protein
MRSRDKFCNSFYKPNIALKSNRLKAQQNSIQLLVQYSGLGLIESLGTLSFGHLPQYRQPPNPTLSKQNSSIAENSNNLSSSRTKKNKPNFEQKLEALQDENCFLKEYMNYIEKVLNACKKKFLELECNPQDIDDYLKLKLSENTDKKS